MRGLALLLALAVGASGCNPRSGDAHSGGGAASAASSSTATLPQIELVRGGKPVVLDDAATRALAERVLKALAVCNFDSRKEARVFGDADLPALWARREATAHLRLRYPADQVVSAVAGRLVFRELLLSIDEPHGPEPALAKDAQGVYGLKKCGYDDRLLGCVPELARHFTPPSACPPGF